MQTAKGYAEHEADVASAVRQMDDETLNRFVHSSEVDELDRELGRQEQRARQLVKDQTAVAEKAHAAEKAREARTAARAAARASVAEEGTSAAQPPTAPASGGNQEHAEKFAAILRRRGFNALARPTKRIQGRDVIDGWTVNVHDNKHEVGVVAAWWGRKHFTAFLEIAGHCDRTEEAAELMGMMLRSFDGGLELVLPDEMAELREKALGLE